VSSEPPRYESSDEMTAVLPRAPVSEVPGPTIEQLADVERMKRDAQDAETLVSCPWCCGEGMVTPEKHALWMAKYLELGGVEP
jgi:hypothetical protein